MNSFTTTVTRHALTKYENRKEFRIYYKGEKPSALSFFIKKQHLLDKFFQKQIDGNTSVQSQSETEGSL